MWKLAPVATLLVVVSACGASAVAPPSRDVGTRMDGAVPAAVEALPLVDSTGHVRHLSDYRGKVVVVQDTMTLCQETCPIDTAALVRTAEAVDHAGLEHRVVFLTVTVDPARDDVAQLAAYRRIYGGPANWLTLTGSAADVDRLWNYLGVYRKKVAEDQPPAKNWRTGQVLTYDVEHSDEVFFFDAHGKERFLLEGMPDSAGRKDIPKQIYGFLSAEGRKNLQPGKGSWTEKQAVGVVSWLTDHQISG